MTEFDVYEDTKAILTTSGTVVAANTNYPAIDLQGFESFFIHAALYFLAGSGSLYVQSSDDNATWADVPSDLIVGRDPAITVDGALIYQLTSGTKSSRIQLLTKDRYIRFRYGIHGAGTHVVHALVIASKSAEGPVPAQY